MTMQDGIQSEEKLLQAALASARDTRLLLLDRGASRQVGEAYSSLFGSTAAVVIADETTFAVEAEAVVNSLRSRGQTMADPIVLPAEGLYAEYSFVDQLVERLTAIGAVPIAVGAGTINDLVKLAAHRCGRRYLCVATAASMDGYTAYGASITYKGSKQTFDCPAPLGVVADLDVMAAAPPSMNAAGYADLAAKCPAGADWIAADFLGEEKIDEFAWDLVQSRLREWMADPAGVQRGDLETVRRIAVALMMTGFAMQAACTSRPASGAEHQFSHLWDMEHHTHEGYAPSHGFKVAIGSLASLGLYEALEELDVGAIDVEAAVDGWPTAAGNNLEIAGLFEIEELAEKATEESGAKLVPREALRAQLTTLKAGWPELSQRLRTHLVPRDEFRDMLAAAGAPTKSEQIGISRERLRASYRQAYHIRRRFTVLDVARRTGLMAPALEQIFS